MTAHIAHLPIRPSDDADCACITGQAEIVERVGFCPVWRRSDRNGLETIQKFSSGAINPMRCHSQKAARWGWC